MPAIRLRRWLTPAVPVLLALWSAVLLPGAAPPDSKPGPDQPADLVAPAGALLIASAGIADPRFYHTVILLMRHDRQGAFGIVINRPLEERSLASLLAAIGDKKAPRDAPGDATGNAPGEAPGDVSGITGTIRIFAGGPVQPEAGFIVHTADYHRPETMAVDGIVAMTASPDILRDIGRGKGPAKSFLALGYAGWGPGQLEGEVARRDWFTAPDDAALVFDEDRADLWRLALARRMQEL